ncbi:MAG: nuclear transport factor 2 family protein [Pseudonocardiales bacterium]|nr:nuclear transport factor 2 family protein [Pseudonocardiales bacterium]
MSTNAEIIQASYSAFARGDIDAAMEPFSPAIEWTHPHGTNDYGLGGTKKGLKQVRDFMAQAGPVFSELRPTPEDFVESGDRVMVIGAYHLRVAHSEQTRKVPFVHSWRLADGKVTHFEDYHDTAGVRTLLGTKEAGMSPREQILRLGLGFWSAKALLVAVELGVFTELAVQPLDAETLRVKLGLHERSARDFFDALVALKVLDRENGLYRNTPASAAVLDESDPEQYLGDLLQFMNNQSYPSWGNLKPALQTGLPQNDARDGESELFDVLYPNPEPLRNFLRAMASGAMGAIHALVERFPWEKYATVADVGCAKGALLSRVLRRHPHLSGVGLDLPPVGPIFAETAEQFGLVDRMRFVAGSFFTDPLPSADVIVLGHVLHDWDLKTKRMLLEKAYKVLPDGGTVVIYEFLIDDDRRHNTLGLLMSLHMLLVSSGGFDYTGADCVGWLSDAGFRDCYVEHLWGPESMVVGTK